MNQLELRPYQMDGISQIRDAFKRGYRRPLVYAPCGAGKSELAAYMLNSSQQKGKKSMFIVDRIVLANQMSERLSKYSIRHGIIQASNPKFNPSALVQVASAQTLESRGSPDANFLIVDECHNTRSSSKKMLIENDLKCVGLSASPTTKGLGKVYDCVVNLTTMKQLVDDGFLIAPKVFATTEIDVNGVPVVAGEFQAEELEKRAMKIVGDVVVDTMKIISLEFAGVIPKMILFSPSVAYGEELVRRFASVGVNLVNISYKDKQDYKSQIIADFSKDDTLIHGLISVDVLSKGFDVPNIALGLSIRSFRKSLSSHIQQFGRICRIAKDKEKAVWLDFSGNYLRFNEDFSRIYNEGISSLDDGLEKPKAEKTQKEKAELVCPSCKSIWQGGLSCMNCGFQKPLRTKVIEAPGAMIELNSKGETAFITSTEFWGMCQQKLKEGWDHSRAIAVYRATFGVKPPAFDGVVTEISLEFDMAMKRSLQKYHARKNIIQNYVAKNRGMAV